MTRKTTVTLPDDLHAKWRSTGLPATEIFKRGLDGTGDTARHTAAEARLAKLETPGTLFPARPLDDDPETLFTEPPSLEEIEQRREQRDELRAREWHRHLTHLIKPGKNGQRIATAGDAGAAFRIGSQSARDRMRLIASFGLATLLDDGEPPFRWLVHDEHQDD